MTQRSLRRIASVTLACGLVALSGTVLASTSGWTTSGDFAAGSLASTVVDADGVVLDTTGVGRPNPAIPWWDASWGQRRCLTVTNNEAASLDEFQIAVEFDTATPIAAGRLSATGDDLRAVASDGSTLLDLWIEGPIDDAATRVWIQTDTLPPGDSEICLYYDNPAAGPVSDPLAPFTYDSPRPLYVAVAASQAGVDLAVVSYVDGNEVSDGTTTVTLAAGATAVLPGASHTAETVITATGPLALRGVGNAVDTYVPIAFAGTEFVIPTTRSTNRLSLHAPFADAAVTILHSGTTTTATVPAGSTVTVDADVTSTADSAVVTADVPVLVTHAASSTTDVFVAVPASDEPLYGIRSTQHLTGFSVDGSSAAVTESDGGSLGISGDRGDQVVRTGGGSQGTGPAVRLEPSAGAGVAAIQQADSDGLESSTYWPESELNVQYRVATLSQYVALACPEQASANVAIGGTPTDCTGVGGASYPGKARATTVAAGTLFSSLDGVPFHLYAEDQSSNDEANVLGPKQARLATANPPTVVVGGEESPYASAGTWASNVVDTGCSTFFDTIRWNPGSQPGGTTLTFQVASSTAAGGPFVPVGPDGTPATTYTAAAGQPVAAVHEGDRFFQVVATLASGDLVLTPRLDDVEVDWEGSVTISGSIFADDDGDGGFDASESGIGSVGVSLWLDDGDGTFDPSSDTEVASGSSGAGGAYSFAGRRPGVYFVSADESAIDQAHLLGSTTGNPSAAIVADECDSVAVDIGWEFGARVEGIVFTDSDGDGTRDTGEPGAPGVITQLWLDDGDGSFDRLSDTLVRTVGTDASGVAAFGVVRAGGYFVYVAPDDAPAGHRPTATTDDPIALPGLTAGDDAAAEIGFVREGSISGTVSGSGAGTPPVADVFMALYLDDGDGVFDATADALTSATLTAADGGYDFAALAAGSYWVVPGPTPADYLPGDPVAAALPSGADITVDVLLRRASSIGGLVIADADGIVDPSTMFLGGVELTLHLDDGDGAFDASADEVVDSVVSDGSGAFVFDGVAPGDYFVVADLGDGIIGSSTTIRAPNPVGPVAAGTSDVLFVADPLDLTLPATGGESLLLLLIAALVFGAGVAAVGVSARRTALH